MKTMLSLALLAGLMLPALGHAQEAEVPHQAWTFEGLRGTYDKKEVYRGYQVFTQVCMNCHSAKYVSHRDLMKTGFTEPEVATLAKALNMKVDAKLLTALSPDDAIGSYGKVPPDLSMMAKAREGGADYIYAVLTGYSDDKAEIAKDLPGGLPPNAHFNRAFPGHAIAMPPPLTGPDLVKYDDGTKATVEQMAHDVSTFLQWTAEPERIERQHLGVYVLIYLGIFLVLTYFTKRAIWRDVH
jgi:ubiquinol-cytochrome c reductase cytochrome c1 subunit